MSLNTCLIPVMIYWAMLHVSPKKLMIDAGEAEENYEKEISPEIEYYYWAKELIDRVL